MLSSKGGPFLSTIFKSVLGFFTPSYHATTPSIFFSLVPFLQPPREVLLEHWEWSQAGRKSWMELCIHTMSLWEPKMSSGNETLIQMNMLFPDCFQPASEQTRR